MTLLLLIIIPFVFIIGYIVIHSFDEIGDLELLYLMFITFVGILAGALLGSYKSSEYSCEKKSTAQGLEYKYGFWEGCLVKERDGNYIDYDKYRVLK